MLFERIRRYAPPLVILVSGLTVAIMVPGPVRIVAAVLTVVAILWFATKTRDDKGNDRRYGPGS